MGVKAIDFCCGAGGLTKGLEQAGIKVVAGLDNTWEVKETYENNNRESKFYLTRLEDAEIGRMYKEANIESGDATIYAAGTPCQPFSTLNTRKGEDRRANLLLELGKIVEERPADYLIVENVPGLNGGRGKEIYEEFRKVLEKKGYKIQAEKLDAVNYGVPQRRKRFILVAYRHGNPCLPPGRKDIERTVKEAIGGYPALEAGEQDGTILNHEARALADHHQRIVEAIPRNGGSRKDVEDTTILLRCHQRSPNAHRDVFGRMSWEKPSPTLTARCTDVYCGRFIHPEQNRGISLREAAALQSFPDDYEFLGKSFLQKTKQIGNALPVELGKRLGEAALKCFGVKENSNE